MKRDLLPLTSSRAGGYKRADLAFEHIKQQLIDGTLAAGARIDVNALVEGLATSRQPVLAAINRLATEGFVRVVPQVGCWVADIEPREVADFFRMFAVTEGLACALAAERRSAAGMLHLRRAFDDLERLVAAESDPATLQRQYFLLNRRFHSAIHAIAQSGFVATHAASMWDRCDFYLASANRKTQGERAHDSQREHADIVVAIDSGNAAVARDLMVAHIDSFGRAAVKRPKSRG